MAEERLPLLRGKITSVELYRNTRGNQRSPALDMSSYDIAGQEQRLLAQLDEIARHARARPVPRDPLAVREVIAVHPRSGLQLAAEQLDDASDARLIGTRPRSGAVLLDVKSSDLSYLREKIEAFGDDSRVRRREKDGVETIRRAYESAIAPIDTIRLASLEDVWGESRPLTDLDLKLGYWMEIACRGGYRDAPEERQKSRAQICSQLNKMNLLEKELPEFLAPEQIYFFARLSVAQLEVLRATTDCIYDVALAPGPIRDLYLLEDPPPGPLPPFRLIPPAPEAPSVVVLDTGIATGHPLLEGAILSATMAAPEIPSPEDTYGHGTKMAGIALYRDLGEAIERGGDEALHWLQSSRVLIEPKRGLGADENHEMWSKLTEKAVLAAEAADPHARDRVFVLAVSRSMQEPPLDRVEPTLWSHAVDQLAFGGPRTRLMIVAAGNAREGQWTSLAEHHPQLQLSELIHQPAQAANALSVGAYTERTALPPSKDYEEARVVATVRGGISPFTSVGLTGGEWPVKPDVVLEGGNLAVSPLLHDANVPTLNALTTSHRHTSGQPLGQLSMTSEASARAAHLAARIWAANPKLRAETVRGLIVHSASWTPAMKKQFKGKHDRLLACGYGVPDPQLASQCARGIATVFIEDSMPNAVEEVEEKKVKPKRPATSPTELKQRRQWKLFRLPIPDSLMSGEDPEAELRVTLSYFAEPNKFGRSTFRGLDLKWDMQGPHETETAFQQRVNMLRRPKGPDGKPLKIAKTRSFKWEVGIDARSRGTVQSDRWKGKTSMLVGDKLIAVFPVLGWWDQRRALKLQEMPFSLIVTVRAPGIYAVVKPLLEAQASIPVEVEV